MLESWPALIFLGVVLAVFIYGIVGFMIKMQTTRENRKIAENKIAELEEEKEKLSSYIANLKTDKGIEESIRDKFGLAKEGEGMIVVVEDKNLPETAKESEGFFSFFINWFK